MCGIAGRYNYRSSGDTSSTLIKRMVGALHHRGPDECGIYLDDWVGLGNARLSILDLSGGTQPIHNEDESLWIVYNGEIFNYPELREDLQKKGHTFATSSDTEVIVHLYEEKGSACLGDLNGQFAFAIWDSNKKELFLARDRVGIHPLYYLINEDYLIFASEIKSIFMDEHVARDIKPSSIHQVFSFWTTLPGETIFKNIQELPPGHYLKASQTQMTVQKYWEMPFYPPEEQLTWDTDQTCERIQELLLDAVRIRLRADVPVGCYLSGGLDSSGIATLIAKNFNNSLRTFGIRFEEAPFDEGEHQRLMVSFLGTDHTEIQATHDKIGSVFADVLWHCEKPLLRTAPAPLFLLSDLVNKSGYKVVLTGEGADEVFAGYNIFREAKARAFLAKQPDSKFRGLLLGKLYPYIFRNPRLRAMQQSFFSAGLDKVKEPFFSHHIRWQTTGKITTFLSDEIRQAVDPQENYTKITQILPPTFNEWDMLSKAQYLETIIFMSNYLLSSQGDRVAMAHSVEIRVPYLDHRLIDFMGRVSPTLKMRGLKEKYILKKSFRNILPQQIVARPKHPYRAPIGQSLLHKTSSDYSDTVLSDQALKNAGLFNITKVRKLFDKLRTMDQPGEVDSMALAGIISTQMIYDQFVANFPFRSIKQAVPDLIVDKRTGK